jgi:amino acid adenylation domain-containing protein
VTYRYRHLLHQLLDDSAERFPDRTAVVDRDRLATYQEVSHRSGQLANLLGQLGVRRGDRVGIYLEKSLEAVVGIYGVLKAGAAYVPLDPRAPMARLGYMAGNCGIRWLVTGRRQAGAWGELLAHGAPLQHLVVMNAGPESDLEEASAGLQLATAEALDAHSEQTPATGTIDLDLAYILYTSGSTGAPKGVMLSHLNGMTFVNWTVEEFGVREEDRLSSHAPFHFDLSVFDLFGASHAGAALVLVPPAVSVFPIEVARFIRDNEISVWYSVPSILSMMTDRGQVGESDFRHLRTILFAGEVFPTKYLSRLMRLLPHVEFANLYGPTETNVCTFYRMPEPPLEDAGDIPIGRAIANVSTFVVTPEGRRAAPGEVGELLVRGTTVMRGYWGDPDKTAERLVPDPFGDQFQDQVYRTGDMVEELPQGDYRFLGRKDNQIKSRGYRIELGEIETALYAHPEVVECAVIAVPDELISNRIRAFVVSREGLLEAELVRFCSDRIPQYMIPEAFEFRETLPKTSTGKIDRQSLSAEGAALPAASR